MSYPNVNRNYHQLNSDASRNQNLKKNYENLNDKIRNLQAELQQNRQPALDVDQYLHQKMDQPDLSPIGSQVHTYITTVNSMDNEGFPRSSQQRPGPKIGNKVDEIKTQQEFGNRSYQQQKSEASDSSPKRYTASFKNKKLGADEVKTRLKKIFQFYTTFGDRCNTSNLKSNKFHKMMSDANIREQYISVKDLDLLFVAENKHKPNMDFNTFLQLLVKVAEYRYENTLPSREALERFIKEHMLPLYDNIYQHTDLGIEEGSLKEPIKENVLLILKAVHGPLLKIYQIYFPWEIRTSQEPHVIKQRTEMALFGVLKEFDVCPSIMTKGAAFMVWTEVMETPVRELSRNPRIENMVPFMEKDIGIQFTFSRFCTLLIRIASIAYEEHLRTVNKEFSQSEKFALLLERMDLSIGMMSFEKKTHVTHNSKMSLLVPKNVIEQAAAREWDRNGNPMHASQLAYANGSKSSMNANSPAQNWQGFSDSFNRSSSAEKVNRAIGATSQAAKTFQNMLTISGQRQLKTETGQEGYTGRFDQYFFDDPELPLLFDTYNESLMRIFQYYCSYGEPMNNSKLKSIKFVRLLKEAGLITAATRFEPGRSIHNSQVDIGMNQFTQTDADIIFISLTGNKPRDVNEKEFKYDPNIRSPSLGINNHLTKQNLALGGNQGKLSYEGFLKSIEMVAHKILPEHNIVQAVNYVLDKHILDLENIIAQAQVEQRYMGGSSLKLLVELLKDPEMVGFLSLVHKSMMVYYNFYADSRGLMNFTKFVQFCKHFSIFPDILAKARIKSFFQTLAAIHSQSEAGERPQLNSTKKSLTIEKKTSETTDEEVIDQHLFVEGLALCAFEVPYNDPQPPNIAKVCYFLERINQSEGSGIVQKQMGLTRSPTGASWDILFFIKQKYPEMFGYKKDLSPLEKSKNKNFEDLMSSTNWEF